ncbi:MAG: TraR/DksA C4-type zinc finger protein [Acidobacteriota bacterium]|nr:TraR/DksA C4-type zinc finger protein [Acidobacteriota bacterium]
MKTTKSQKSRMNGDRYQDLKQMLEDRRREILSEVQEKIRDARTEGNWGKLNEVLDDGESSEADIQEDIEFALIQMKAETLHKIDEALSRLEEGAYGYCFECGEEISEQRLRALPFAVRCKDCEEAREVAQQRERLLAQRRGSSSLFFDMSH